MGKILITQTKSTIKKTERQKRTVKALGLGKINRSVEVEATLSILGMVNKVHHIVEVKEL